MTMTSNSQALVRREESHELLPAVLTAIQRRNVIVQAMQKEVMEKDRDFGCIPGTDKPTLLKPGAEKLCTLFGLCVEKPEIIEKEQDWTGEHHGGEPFFYYLFCQRLTRNGETVAAQLGSCNSWEKKYRYRNADRVCPRCGKPAIKRSQYPPRNDPKADPGWYCHSKAGGCGANFPADAAEIASQQTGRMKNPDVADQVNSILKMAQKRALVAATLVATNASEFFTQDVEDMEIIDAEYTVSEKQSTQSAKQPSATNGHGEPKKPQTGADLEPLIRDIAHKWERAGYCRAADVFLKIGDWAHSQGCDKPMKEWPASLVNQAGVFMRRLLAQLKTPAPEAMMQTIDQLTEKLGWDEAYREEYLSNINLIQPGEVANEHKAQSIILHLQQKLREQEEETVPETSDQPDTEEVPF